MKKIALLIIIALVIVGCQKSHYTYENSQTIVSTKRDTNKSYPISVKMAYRGLKENKKDHSLAMKFDLLAQNFGNKKVTLNPESYYLLDEDGQKFEGIARKEHKNLDIAPNASTTFPLFYPLSQPNKLEKMKSFRFVWSYDAENVNYEMITKFEKKRLRHEKDKFGYPYSARFFNGPESYKRLGHGPYWRYQNLQNSGFRKNRN